MRKQQNLAYIESTTNMLWAYIKQVAQNKWTLVQVIG